MVELFNKGGLFMWPLLGCLVIGIAFVFERFWSLSRASINAKEFFIKIRQSLEDGGLEDAVELCANTRGPVASIFHAALLKADQGLERMEKAIEDAGSIEMAFLERGMIWLSTIISIAPLLGFLGTVSGMIRAFSAIARRGDVEPSIVAGGISEALITTAAGLAIAILIQAFYNFFASRIDRIVIDMEESSVALVDALVEMGYTEQTKGVVQNRRKSAER
ncbi:MAG: flagellar motor protein MotA [Candidatus Latescibacteria bacterium 4484_181]|nr:MAG: flagellar motor protein MotA [Candidatus Latescibacteria bacterium 4484_181]RKY68462.1 MAG: MotA/TolQ/ExbB proton channel family protein [Candidatus Latescibacterota bacterium]RKY73070.1 MAG: MotA/TolQ/ExbB proton channel family protein [Candidatus Latescibacterota bacterium]HDN67464.1 MotA/TolQ/ExbB proton channel family protein [Bacillota bacterium]